MPRVEAVETAGQMVAAGCQVEWGANADDAVTGPVHGFAGADDYWSRSSAKPWLKAITVPALVVNPRNDPFLPAFALPGVGETSPSVRREQPAGGGHVGFVSGPFPGNLDWLPQRLLHFFLYETP